jgi:hypothetical protein
MRIEAQQVQDCGLQIEDGHFVLGDEVAKVVGFAEDQARLDAAPGHPDGEAMLVMIASQELRAGPLFVHRRAAEFSAPDHQRFVQQPAGLEILDQRSDRLIDFLALLR